MLQELRSQVDDTPIDNSIIPEFIVHLVSRTKNIRNTMEDIGHSFTEILQRNILKPEAIEAISVNYIRENPMEFKKMLQCKLERAGIKANPKLFDFLLNIAADQAPKLLEQNIHLPLGAFKKSFQLLENDMPNTVKNAQLNALSKEVTPSRFIEKIRHFKWKLFVERGPNFILGDIGPLTTTNPTGEFKSFAFLKENEPYQVFLPVSDRQLIIGSESDGINKEDIETINNASASLSTDFFIGSKVTDKTIHYAGLIGSKTFPFSVEELYDFELLIQAKMLRNAH